MCCMQDLFLERLYEQLDATGLAENTYVVIVGDHGEVINSCSKRRPMPVGIHSVFFASKFTCNWTIGAGGSSASASRQLFFVLLFCVDRF